MQIKVKLLASLAERFGQREADVDAAAGATAEQVWARVAGDAPMLPNMLIAVNKEYADRRRPLADGDEVAFFPPVTGG
jgi:molybdopterin converting factor subunit 1